jgi:excisionase family DNA binding protein
MRQSTNTPPLFGRIPDVRRIFGLTRSRTYELLTAGHIAAVKDGRALLIDLRSVERYLNDRPKAQLRVGKAGTSPSANPQK